MSKFICLCGLTFKKQIEADIHTKFFEDIAFAGGFPHHQIFKQHWKARLATWFFNYPWSRLMRFVGGYMVYFVFIHHFKIDLNWWEAMMVGIGMGLYIE